MRNKSIGIASGIAILGVLIAGMWFVLNKSEPQDLGTSQATPNNPIEEVPSDTISYPHDDPESPYIDLDAKLHVQRGLTLDPEIITINYELKDVTLCGETYKAKQVMIDGVDVVQRVAELLAEASSENTEQVCYLLQQSAGRKFNGKIGIGEEMHISILQNQASDGGYMLDVSIGQRLYAYAGVTENGDATWYSALNILIDHKSNYVGLGLYDSELGTVVFGSLRK